MFRSEWLFFLPETLSFLVVGGLKKTLGHVKTSFLNELCQFSDRVPGVTVSSF